MFLVLILHIHKGYFHGQQSPQALHHQAVLQPQTVEENGRRVLQWGGGKKSKVFTQPLRIPRNHHLMLVMRVKMGTLLGIWFIWWWCKIMQTMNRRSSSTKAILRSGSGSISNFGRRWQLRVRKLMTRDKWWTLCSCKCWIEMGGGGGGGPQKTNKTPPK